jgi:hypothetical protein
MSSSLYLWRKLGRAGIEVIEWIILFHYRREHKLIKEIHWKYHMQNTDEKTYEWVAIKAFFI